MLILLVLYLEFSSSTNLQIVENKNGSVFNLFVSQHLQYYNCSFIHSYGHFCFCYYSSIFKSANHKLELISYFLPIYQTSMRSSVMVDFVLLRLKKCHGQHL